MRFPVVPPETDAILEKVGSTERLVAVFRHSKVVDGKGRYLHWDQLRFRTPPGGLTAEEWWVATRLARGGAAQKLMLSDAQGGAFSFCEPPLLRARLRDLDLNAGGVLGSGPQGLSAGEGRSHLTRSLAEEPFASSLIEGAATTRQIAKKMIFEGRPAETPSERMVLNNYQAMELVDQHKNDDLTLKLLLEIHRTVTRGTLDDENDAGRVRTGDDVRVVDETTNEPLHQPPAAADLPQRLERLLAFANAADSTDEWMHPLLRATTLHFMLAYEHPFVDGNGRVARALFYWSALRAGYWLLKYVSISSVLAQSKTAYGRSFLHVETDGSDLTYFLDHHTEVLSQAVANLHSYVERKKAEVQAVERQLSARSLARSFNHRQATILNAMVRERLPEVTIAAHRTRFGVSWLTAQRDLEDLLAQGLLTKRARGRLSVYEAGADMGSRLSDRTPVQG